MRNKKHFKNYLPYIVFLSIMILLLDYKFCKAIPNFFFLNSFSKENVEAYWRAVIEIVIVTISIFTFWQTSDHFFFEKQIHNENQKKETIRRYQDLVRSAIDIFSEKNDDEDACLFAVQIIQNIISLYEKSEFTRTLEKQSEPFQIISIEGIVCLLKKHLDRVWSKQRPSDEIRQDIVQVIRLLYVNNRLWEQVDIKKCGANRFKNLCINMEYFDCVPLKDMEFVNIVFISNKDYLKILFEGINVFEHCIFKCNFSTFLNKYGQIIFRKCELQKFKMLESNDFIQNKESIKGTKKIEFIETTCKGYVNLNDNIFDSIIIESCMFENLFSLQRIKVSSEMEVCGTEFSDGIDFQGSIFEWKVQFKNVNCKKLFYFGESIFCKRDRVDFMDVYVEDFPPSNWQTLLYDEKQIGQNSSKCFKDCYEIVQHEIDQKQELINKH